MRRHLLHPVLLITPPREPDTAPDLGLTDVQGRDPFNDLLVIC
jgi:hypothetical protein